MGEGCRIDRTPPFPPRIKLPSKCPALETKVKLDLLTDIDMLLMAEKGIRGGISHDIYQYLLITNT